MAATRYPLALEVGGAFGMFADPASGGDAHSFPVPPPSACRGMISSIAFAHGVDIEIAAVGVCYRPKWTSGAYSTMSAYRKPSQLLEGHPYLGHESILFRPRFQILGFVSNQHGWRHKVSPALLAMTDNPAHLVHDHFYRRLRRGRCLRPVAMGRKEMLADYFGSFVSQINTGYDHCIPVMPLMRYVDNRLVVSQIRLLEIRQGVARYLPEVPVVVENGRLAFGEPNLQKALENSLRDAPVYTH